jgi:hypothetical protein
MRAALLMLLAGGLVLAAAAQAELRQAPQSPPGPSAGQPVVPSGPLRLQCWQYGEKILDLGALGDLQAPPARVGDWLSFRSSLGAGDALVLAPIGDAICLVGSDRAEPKR